MMRERSRRDGFTGISHPSCIKRFGCKWCSRQGSGLCCGLVQGKIHTFSFGSLLIHLSSSKGKNKGWCCVCEWMSEWSTLDAQTLGEPQDDDDADDARPSSPTHHRQRDACCCIRDQHCFVFSSRNLFPALQLLWSQPQTYLGLCFCLSHYLLQ